MTTITLRKNLNGMNTVGMDEYVDEREIEDLVAWIDHIPLSRPKTNMHKDFEDGVLMAEIIKHYFPKMVELHNYNPACNIKQKIENWYLLNRRVLKRLGMDLSDDVIRALANGKRHVVERILILLRMQIDRYLTRQGRSRREIDLEIMNSKEQQSDSLKDIGPKSPKDTAKDPKDPKDQKDPNSQALVPVSKLTGRSSPAKSPRKVYPKGDIPHNHPDRSRYSVDRYPLLPLGFRTYFADKKLITDLPIYSYMYNASHIPRVLMEEKEIECLQKDETIHMLNAKIRSMEHLLNLKQSRIEDLQARLLGSRGMYYVTAGGTRKVIR